MGLDEEAVATKVSPPPPPPRPKITVPPRVPFESVFSVGSVPGFSPGPMTLMSSFFSPDSNSFSFSQLLAGAIASPVARPGFLSTESNVQETISREVDFGDKNEKGLLRDYKQNKPMGLMVPNSPMFFFPSGLSPSGLLNSPGFLSPLQSPFGMSHQQALAHVTAQAAFSQSLNQMQADYQRSSAEAPSMEATPYVNTLQLKADNVSVLESQNLEASQFDKKPAYFYGDKPDNDGYNWRKYGQKTVKEKEHPRSYYKCTYPDCPVKKKVGRGQDGHIAEITYKGQHNHHLPQPNIRAKNGIVKDELRVQNQTTMEILHVAQASQLHLVKPELPTHVPAERIAIGIEADEMEDSAVVIDEDNDNDDEPNAKRRNVEVGERVPCKTVNEQKIVVHTRSEVDILIDGYKWRKYGQKVVKGNSHPRSYYRCTYPGCKVRKHVERSSADAKEVVTTYQGNHSHDTPIAIARGGSGS